MFRHLLVPTDGSELSQLAVDQALEMASEIGAKVTFFHVQPSFYGRPDVLGEGLVLDPPERAVQQGQRGVRPIGVGASQGQGQREASPLLVPPR